MYIHCKISLGHKPKPAHKNARVRERERERVTGRERGKTQKLRFYRV